MVNRSKLISLSIRNVGCIGNDPLVVKLDDIVCLVGKNNAGKSTVLRAYELATGKADFSAKIDRCQWAPEEQPSEILLDVHIPKGIGNVDDKWKSEKDGMQVVRSRWQWTGPEFKRVRTTWDPSVNNWAEDGKAGGADPVFTSRLPRALRIGSLDDAKTSEATLLKLALSPVLKELTTLESDPESVLAKSLKDIMSFIDGRASEHQARFSRIADGVTKGFQGVFPRLGVRMDVKTAIPKVSIDDLLNKGTQLLIADGTSETSLAQQGTGARRALFWAMLQVHNEITRENDLKEKARKALDDQLKKIKKTKDEKKIEELEALIKAVDDGGPLPEGEDDPAFPGYLLLMDEPENALHPMAARAAQRHLYRLAEDADWQVILTTHSPYFINPLADHTTVVRLERDAADEKARVTPSTYSADMQEFDGPTKRWLQAMQQMDTSLAEMFFGSYPILVEGDTEHAAFLAAILEAEHELADKVTIVRARGKAILHPLVRILRHFKVSFGIVHDADPPYKTDGSGNGMWSENRKILEEVEGCRKDGLRVIHRISVVDFERFLDGPELGKDKPVAAYEVISGDEAMKKRVRDLLTDLLNSERHTPFPGATSVDDQMALLTAEVRAWATKMGEQENLRYKGNPAP